MHPVAVIDKIFQLVRRREICLVSVAYPEISDIKDRVADLSKIVSLLSSHAEGAEQCRKELSGLDFTFFTSKGISIETKHLNLSHLLRKMLLRD